MSIVGGSVAACWMAVIASSRSRSAHRPHRCRTRTAADIGYQPDSRVWALSNRVFAAELPFVDDRHDAGFGARYDESTRWAIGAVIAKRMDSRQPVKRRGGSHPTD